MRFSTFMVSGSKEIMIWMCSLLPFSVDQDAAYREKEWTCYSKTNLNIVLADVQMNRYGYNLYTAGHQCTNNLHIEVIWQYDSCDKGQFQQREHHCRTPRSAEVLSQSGETSTPRFTGIKSVAIVDASGVLVAASGVVYDSSLFSLEFAVSTKLLTSDCTNKDQCAPDKSVIWVSIGLGSGLSPTRHKSFAWTDADVFPWLTVRQCMCQWIVTAAVHVAVCHLSGAGRLSEPVLTH